MDIGQSYIKTYKDLFLKFMSESDKGYLDEAALPSYTHSNKLMAWLFWKRVETALQLSEDIKDCSVLDFGCGCGFAFDSNSSWSTLEDEVYLCTGGGGVKTSLPSRQ